MAFSIGGPLCISTVWTTERVSTQTIRGWRAMLARNSYSPFLLVLHNVQQMPEQQQKQRWQTTWTSCWKCFGFWIYERKMQEFFGWVGIFSGSHEQKMRNSPRPFRRRNCATLLFRNSKREPWHFQWYLYRNFCHCHCQELIVRWSLSGYLGGCALIAIISTEPGQSRSISEVLSDGPLVLSGPLGGCFNCYHNYGARPVTVDNTCKWGFVVRWGLVLSGGLGAVLIAIIRVPTEPGQSRSPAG